MTELRTLPKEEFGRLAELYDGFVPNPQYSIAIVAEEGERIVARIFLLAPVHIEGPWIAEEARCGTLAQRLVNRAEREARACGLNRLFAYAINPEIEDYLARLGFSQQPMTVWAKHI